MRYQKVASLICVALIAASSMFVIGCGGSNRSASTNTSSSSANSSAQSSAQQQKETKESSAEIKWNTSEVDAQKNGNFTPAVKVLNKTDDMNAVAEDVDAAAVMQKPWEYYGKVRGFGHDCG